MRRLITFVCENCGGEQTTRTDTSVRSIDCVCGGKMTRPVEVPSVHFKGSGWTRDYRKIDADAQRSRS
jgi:predicted nucleic acid-binding Zn ribbon protein